MGGSGLRHRRVRGFSVERLIESTRRGGFDYLRTESRRSPAGYEVVFVLFTRSGSDSVWWVRVTHNGWLSEGVTVKSALDRELELQVGL